MKRAPAILLLVVMGLPIASPLSAFAGATTLPACCRRDGKHHCMQTMDSRVENSRQTSPSFSRIEMKCPQFPRVLTSPVHGPLGLSASSAIFAEIGSHPALAPQTESNYRISLVRSNQKRGPPSVVRS
jgi:hypothetical protein